MLNKSTIRPVIAAQDVNRARLWYTDKLGLTPVREEADGIVFQVGSTEFFLYQTPVAGTAQNTVASFEVADFDATMTDMKEHGVVFEEYDYPDFKTVNGVVMLGDVRAAWFKDSEGNILALSEKRS